MMSHLIAMLMVWSSLILLLDAAAPKAVLFSVWPKRGSVAGGTYLTLKGVGWARGGMPGFTRAFINGKECKQNQGIILDSTDVNFVCWTPPLLEPGQYMDDYYMNPGYEVKVYITTLDGETTQATCNGYCSFQYTESETPTVQFASMGAFAGGIVRLSGVLRYQDSSAYWVRIGGDQRGGGVGGYLCYVDPKLQVGYDSYSGATAVTDGGYGSVLCRVGTGNSSIEAGRYPLFLEPRDNGPSGRGFGQPLFYSYASQNFSMLPNNINGKFTSLPNNQTILSTTGFGIAIYPIITNVNLNEVGTGGGTLLKIIGNGFSSVEANNEVFVGSDVPCKVLSSSQTHINCITNASSVSPDIRSDVYYPGGTGLLRQIFVKGKMPTATENTKLNSYMNSLNSAFGWYSNKRNNDGTLPVLNEPVMPKLTPTFSDIAVDSLSSYTVYPGGGKLDYYVQELQGFFVPPVTANYSFYVRGDDSIAVFLSTSSKKSDLKLIAMSNSYNYNWWTRLPDIQISKKIQLIKDQSYYFRTLMMDMQGNDWFDVALRIHSENETNAEVVNNIQSEAQKSTRSGVCVQKITINADGGTFQIVINYGTGDFYTNPIKYTDLQWGNGGIRNAIVDATGGSSKTPFTQVKNEWIADYQLDAGGNGFRTLDLSFDATNHKYTSKIVFFGPLAANIQPLQVVTSGTAPNGQYFALTRNDGGVVSASTSFIEKGSTDPFYWPAPLDFFRTALQRHPIKVKSNGYLAACNHFPPTGFLANASQLPYNVPGAYYTGYDSMDYSRYCTVSYSNTSVEITQHSVNGVEGATAITGGSIIALSGNGFLPYSRGIGQGTNGANLTLVELDEVSLTATIGNDTISIICETTEATTKKVECTVPHAPAGNYSLDITVGLGKGKFSYYSKLFQYVSSIESISPVSGSRAGGTLLTLTGTGFYRSQNQNSILIGGKVCELVSATPTNLTCLTPALEDSVDTPTAISTSKTTTVSLVVDGQLVPSGYVYSAAMTPLLSSLSRSSLSTAVTSDINVTISNIASSYVYVKGSLHIKFGERICTVRKVQLQTLGSIQEALVTCRLLRTDTLPLPQSPITPSVYFYQLGYAALDASDAPSGGWTLDTSFQITSVSPIVGSMVGGTLLTVTGSGFDSRLENTYVDFQNDNSVNKGDLKNEVRCTVATVASDGKSLTCVTSRPSYETVDDFTAAIDSGFTGSMVVTINNMETVCADLVNNCTFTFSPLYTPKVSKIVFNKTTDIATITGTNLKSPVRVWFGSVEATIISNDESTAIVNIPSQTYGNSSVWVHCGTYGNALDAWKWTYLNPLEVSTITQMYDIKSKGSIEGGQVITIYGNGFSLTPLRNIVKFGTKVARVIFANSSELKVIAPYSGSSTSSTANVAVSISVLDEYKKLTLATFAYKTATYYYSASNTPSVSSINPTTVSKGTRLTIRGTMFGSTGTVTIGEQPCSIITWNATYVSCTVGNTPAGVHQPIIYSDSIGYATVTATKTVTVVLAITSTSTSVLGPGGGSSLTINGNGFSPVITDNYVKICGNNVTVLSASSSSLVIKTPELWTEEANDLYNTFENQVLEGTFTGNGASADITNAVDGKATTRFNSLCSVTLDLGQYSEAALSRVRFFPVLGEYKTFEGSSFYAANNANGPWNLLWTVPLNNFVLDGWNYHDFGVPEYGLRDQNKYRYFKWVAASGSSCTGMEIEFIGRPLVTNNGANCPLSLYVSTYNAHYAKTVTSPTVTMSSTLAIDSANAPVVYSIAPDIGTALGGDLITITGAGFTSGVESIKFNGIACTVNSFNATSITCITGYRTEIFPVSVDVVIKDYGLALVNDTTIVFFSYLDKWSETNTWLFDEPPGKGDTVLVPKGQAILVDMSPPELFLVLVEGRMTFDQSAPELFFDANYIFVLGGTLEAGTENKPYMNKLTITLHGDRDTSIEIPGVGAKCIGVMNAMPDNTTSLPTEPEAKWVRDNVAGMQAVMGKDFGMSLGVIEYSSAVASTDPVNPLTRLIATSAAPAEGSTVPTELRGTVDFHGAPRKRVWTFGGAPAPAGTRDITTLEDIDFEVGEEIVISSTSYASEESERAVVSEVLGPREFRINRPLVYNHDCFTYPGAAIGTTDTYICYEVGLLSRNIVIQGDDNSTTQQFGAHTIAAMGATMRVENIEMRLCGQSLVVGRYCTHFHLASDLSQSYVKSTSFHDSFQRAVTIHASHNLEIRDNVAYHVMAHSFFIEDGNEFNNILEGNLVISQLTSPGPIRSDGQAACFWTASPANIWKNNVCAGSPGNGYWFQPPGAPTGPSATDRIKPNMLPLGAFVNNTVHGTPCGLNLWIPAMPILCSNIEQRLVNTTIWRNGQGMFVGEVNGAVQFDGFKFIESSQGDIFWFHMACESVYSNRPQLVDSVFINTMDPKNRPIAKPGALFPQDEFFYASGLTFVNFGKNPAISTCVDQGCVCGWTGGAQLQSDNGLPYGYTARVEGLKFINSSVRVFWDRTDVLWDLDGSLTGIENGIALPYHSYNDWSECKKDTTGVLGYGLSCESDITARKVTLTRETPWQIQSSRIAVSGGSMLGKWAPANRTEYVLYNQDMGAHQVLLITGHYYGIKHDSNQDFLTLSMRYSEPAYISKADDTEYLGLTFTWIQKRYSNTVYMPAMGCNNPPCTGQTEITPVTKDTLPSPTKNLCGTGNYPSGKGNNTWSVMFNKKAVTANALWNTSHLGENLPQGKSMVYTFDVQYNLCPPWGCSAGPATGNLGAPKAWSTVSWPAEGADITIGATEYIILDVSPPRIGNLVIEGRLEFLDSAKVGALTLTAKSILVWGSLIVGTPSSRRTQPANIVLTGNLYSPNVVVDNRAVLGNKGIMVFGNASFAGTKRVKTWTRLASTANAGATTLSLSSSVLGTSVGTAWVAGDKIVLSSSEYSSYNRSLSQVETATIKSVSADGLTLTLSNPLKYSHFAGPLSVKSDSAIAKKKVAAAVGLLTRNVVIRGDVVSENSSPTYGGHIYVGIVTLGTGASANTFNGKLIADSVQFKDMGKETMQFGAINLEYGKSRLGSLNTISDCAFVNGHNDGIISHGSMNTIVTGNVLETTLQNGIYFDSLSYQASIQNNFVVGNYLSSSTYCCGRDSGYQVYSQASISLSSKPKLLADNYVSAAYDIGYILPGEDCDVASPYMRNNEAAGVQIGFIVLPASSSSNCLKLDGATVWKAAHIGILAQDHSTNFILSNSLISDSHIGVNFFFSAGGTKLLWSEIKNTTVVGTSAASSCSASLTCRAMTKGDKLGTKCNSVFGNNVRRVGILTPTYTNDGKSGTNAAANAAVWPGGWKGCALPWESGFGASRGPVTEMRLTNVILSGFLENDCGKATYALGINPQEVDLTNPVVANKIVWDGVDQKARFYLGNSNRPLYIDKDNTLLGYGTDTSLIRTPQLGTSVSGCISHISSGGYVCPKTLFRSSLFMDIDMESLGAPAAVSVGVESILQPIDITVSGATINYGLDGGGGCTLNLHTPDTVNFLVVPNQEAYLRPLASEPIQSRIYFSSPDPNEKVLYSIFLTKPNSQSLFIDGVKVDTLNDLHPNTAPSDLTIPTLDDLPGTALFRPDLRKFFFVASGGYHYYDIVRNPSVMVKLSFDVPSGSVLDTTSVATSLAALLGISADRIRVVSVHARRRLDSSELQLEILPEAQVVALVVDSAVSVPTVTTNATSNSTTSLPSSSPTSSSAAANSTLAVFQQQSSMVSLSATLQTLASSGELQTVLSTDTGLTVGSIDVTAPTVSVTDPTSTSSDPSYSIYAWLQVGNLPTSAFDSNGSPKNTTIAYLENAFELAMKDKGNSVTAIVSSLFDIGTGAILYNATSRRLTDSSIGVNYTVSASSSVVLTLAQTLTKSTSFTSLYSSYLGSSFNTTVTAAPYDIPKPTSAPTPRPTASPTLSPTAAPTVFPSVSPTVAPSASPTAAPTVAPSASSTTAPTVAPSVSPTFTPTESPSATPTVAPVVPVTATPTASPTVASYKGSVSLQVSGLPDSAFDSNGSPQNTTIAFLENAFELAAKEKDSTISASVTSIFDVSTGSILYEASNRRLSIASIGVNFTVVASSPAVLTTVQSLSQTQSFTSTFAAHLGNSLNISVVVTPILPTSPTVAPTSKSSKTDNGLSDGEIAAIVICSFVGFSAFAAYIAVSFKVVSLPSIFETSNVKYDKGNVEDVDTNADIVLSAADIEASVPTDEDVHVKDVDNESPVVVTDSVVAESEQPSEVPVEDNQEKTDEQDAN